MKEETLENRSQLLPILRECVDVVQMILFKTFRARIALQFPDSDRNFTSMLAGAMLAALFGNANSDERFTTFQQKNRASIEQLLIELPDILNDLRGPLTDALRIQVLCDHQEGHDSSRLLLNAHSLGILIEDRPVPLPSSFVSMVRLLGEQHGLISPPSPQPPADQGSTIH